MDSRARDERYAGSEYIWDIRPNRFVEQYLAGLDPVKRAMSPAP